MKRTVFPPNCEVRNSTPSRLLEFVAKQRRVFAEYGFWLSAQRRTESEKDGYRRYMRDYRRRYRAEHIDKLRAYRKDYWQTVTKPGFECKAEAVGDEVKLKLRAERRAAEQKRAEQEARRQEVHAKYGFWLGKTPQTPEEVAGRERYRKEWGAAYKAAHQEQQKAYRLERNKRIKAEREAKFQKKYRALLAVDPAKAEAFRLKHEKLLVIQNMTHEERVRYRQQKQFERFKARAEREAVVKAERKARRKEREERKRLKREKAAEAHKAKRKAERHTRRDVWLAKCAERRAEAAALEEAERAKAAAFASEREANRAAYLAAKAAALREEPPAAPVLPVPQVLQVPEAGGSQSSATAERPLIVIDEFLPHHPLRNIPLEETAPTDDELADDTPPPEIDYSAGDPPDDPPGDEPPVHTGGDDGSEPGDEFAAFDNMSHEEKKLYTAEKYGFIWGEKPTTPEEIAGRERYTADRARATAERNKRIDEILHGRERKIRAAVKKRKATIARKKREEAAQAARAAKDAEREAKRKEREEARQAARKAKQEAIETAAAEKADRKALLEQAYTVLAYKVRAWENKKRKMRKSLGLPKMKRDFTPEQRETWNTYLRESRAELENWLVERMRKEAAKAAKAVRSEAQPPAEIIAAKQKRAEEREERKRLIREKYGFTLGKIINTPEEIEGRKRWQRDIDAETRKRKHDKITAYNREYRRRKRAEALADAQTRWTPEQWAAWNKRQEKKECPQGSPQWLAREVVKHLARENNLPEDAVLQRIIELDGLDFLLKGAESLGEAKCARPAFVIAAVRALALYLDPDNAEMFVEKRDEGCGMGDETRVSDT